MIRKHELAFGAFTPDHGPVLPSWVLGCGRCYMVADLQDSSRARGNTAMPRARGRVPGQSQARCLKHQESHCGPRAPKAL